MRLDRDRLCNAGVASEKRRDARWMKEDVFTQDYGLNRQQRWDALVSFVEDAFVSRGIIVDLAMHRCGACRCCRGEPCGVERVGAAPPRQRGLAASRGGVRVGFDRLMFRPTYGGGAPGDRSRWQSRCPAVLRPGVG